MLLCFLLAAALAALYTYYELIPLIVAAGIFCLAALVLLMIWSRQKRLKQDAEEERRLLLKKYHSSSPREIQKALQDFQLRYNAVLEAENWEEERRAAFEEQQRAQSDLEESALQELDFSAGDTEAARLGFKKIFVSSYSASDAPTPSGIKVVKVADVPALVKALFK